MVKNEFKEKGYTLLKRLLPLDLCYFITHSFMVQNDQEASMGLPKNTDNQVPTSKFTTYSTSMLDTLNEHIWPVIESVAEEELIPTYSYARLYSNGDILEEHTDRPSCEVSVTIQLGRSHNYSWPIYMAGNRYDLVEGDAVVYKGCDVSHFRSKCDGPIDYYSGQVFCHYVRKNGQFAEWAGDKRFKLDSNLFPFRKYRTASMIMK